MSLLHRSRICGYPGVLSEHKNSLAILLQGDAASGHGGRGGQLRRSAVRIACLHLHHHRQLRPPGLSLGTQVSPTTNRETI